MSCEDREENNMKRLVNGIRNSYSTACTKAVVLGIQNSKQILIVLGVFLITTGIVGMSFGQGLGQGPTGSFSEANFQDDLIRSGVGNLFRLIEGAFGALIMVVAGLGAIIAAAMGAYRAALGMLVVALGAFILRALVSLFFGTQFQVYDEGQN